MPEQKFSLIRWLDEHLEEALLIVLLVIITLLTGMQVVMRRVFQSPLSWSEELCRYSFMWSGFIGLAYFIRKRCEIRIGTFVAFFPAVVQKILLIATNILSLGVLGVFFRVSLTIIRKTWSSGQTTPAIGIPFYLIYLCTVLGFGLGILRLIQVIYIDIRDFRKVPAQTK